MIMDAMAIGLGIIITAVAAVGGYKSRTVSHAMLPFRDPMFLAILALEIVIVILDIADIINGGLAIVGKDITATSTGQFMIICMLALDIGYIMGYIMCKPGDTIFVDMPDDSLSVSKLEPLVFYYHSSGLCIMPQTVSGIICSHLGARHHADMPIHEIARRRYVSMTNGILKLGPISAVPVSMHTVEDESVGLFRIGTRKTKDENKNVIAETPRFLFHVTVQNHVIRFSQSATDDPETFWVKKDVYNEATKDAIAAKQRSARLEVLMTTAAFDAGADLVSGMVNLGTDAQNVQQEIIERIRKERERRGDHSDDNDGAKDQQHS